MTLNSVCFVLLLSYPYTGTLNSVCSALLLSYPYTATLNSVPAFLFTAWQRAHTPTYTHKRTRTHTHTHTHRHMRTHTHPQVAYTCWHTRAHGCSLRETDFESYCFLQRSHQWRFCHAYRPILLQQAKDFFFRCHFDFVFNVYFDFRLWLFAGLDVENTVKCYSWPDSSRDPGRCEHTTPVPQISQKGGCCVQLREARTLAVDVCTQSRQSSLTKLRLRAEHTIKGTKKSLFLFRSLFPVKGKKSVEKVS